jgi:DNA-binding transcriptional MocR family regulator
LDYICRLYKPRMDALNEALNTHFPSAFTTDISGGFFTGLTLVKIKPEQERSFINAAKEAGIGIAAAWDAVAPNCRDLKRKKGLFMRLTFPAFKPDLITWGISTLKKVEVASQ